MNTLINAYLNLANTNLDPEVKRCGLELGSANHWDLAKKRLSYF